ncbi:ABC transporter substrate-binding protein [Selenomonas sp. TAMA-11512]|uniref:ABC transporter substrate-binding protein n=1 Tax=Selenomonas sp. TAMA-11512 TaxID=3095337 RepID=UPI00308F9030|nr:ABC transporter substrate-binding protein [Selenomonas sp. TAMA-11512]
MRYRWFISGVFLLTVFFIAGCGADTAKKEDAADKVFAVVTDDAERTVTLTKKPERIVTLSTSFLEPLHAVGGTVVAKPESRLVNPDWAKDAVNIGTAGQIDIEQVIAQKPDLVLLHKGMHEKYIQMLEDNGIQNVVLEMKSYADVKRDIDILSKLTGEETKGRERIASMDSAIEHIKEKLPGEKKRVAILHSTSQGLSVQLEGSIAGSIVTLLGWENVASEMTPLAKNPDAAPYSMETLVEQNPEILFITSMGKLEEIKADMEARIASNPAWQTIPAVREGHVYYLPQELFLLSPGLEYPTAVETMAKCVYP